MKLPSALSEYVLNPPVSLEEIAVKLRSEAAQRVSGKKILITGASTGVGKATAVLLGAKGGEVILVARGSDGLEETRREIERAGGNAHVLPADLSKGESVDELVAAVVKKFGVVDVLVNNAGRSIRRHAVDAVDRFHDYERTMAINYFGAARLTLGLLPSMLESGSGHIINILTWGTAIRGGLPKYSAYGASKAALGAFGRSLDLECRSGGVRVSSLSLPLVRTEMIAPTAKYESAPTLAPERAADWVLRAIESRRKELYPRFVGALRVLSAVSPTAADAFVKRVI